VKALLVVIALAGTARAAPDLDAIVAGAPGCSGRTQCIGLAFHIAVDDSGPVATASWATAQLTGANHHFEKLDVGFKIVSVDALPASAVRVENRKERDSFAPQVKGTVLHVFVTGQLDDIDKPGDWIYGVTWRARGDTKFVILSTAAWERTLAHELGHVFGLPHSSYPISIMNKTDRAEPPIDKRVFADEEIAAMRPRIAWLLRSKALAHQK
jgi:hypothetical protein